MMLGIVAIYLFGFVGCVNPIISIHRSSNSKPACEESAVYNGPFVENCDSLFDGTEATPNQAYHPGDVHCENETMFSKSEAMVYSFISSLLVGLSGIFPVLMMPNLDEARTANTKTLNKLLSFAVGGLLGDVFLHLLPESWNMPYLTQENFQHNFLCNGLFVLAGLISFCVLEKMMPDNESIDEKHEKSTDEKSWQNCNGNNNIHGFSLKDCSNSELVRKDDGAADFKPDCRSEDASLKPSVKMSGYLNLFANCIDNFTHGLAIGGSYLVSRWVGILTTAAILLHEIPHEIGDFAILLRAGFDRWKAAKYQLLTATGGLIGAAFAHLVDSDASGNRVAWILPFTSGGFIYIALCTVVPDLVRESTSPKESLIQIVLIISGIAVMGLVSLIE